MEELTALLALSRITGINRARKKLLVESHKSVADLFEGREKAPNQADMKAIGSFQAFREIEADLSRLSRMDVAVISIKDKDYPPALRAIPDAPLVLFKKGPLPLTGEAFAIVGARGATFEGMLLAERIAETLSSVGVAVVSGLARGVDASAHKGALRQRGRTIGVLGCGIDTCYPAENWMLFRDIAREGAVLSEYRPGERPWRSNFPERNRIIAGLSKGVLVVEAAQKSGSLITARLALDYGREVMAIPGPVFDDAHKGTNNLIKQGARLVQDISDILTCCFPDLEVRTESAIDMDDDEDYIYKLMTAERVHVDELIEKSRFEARRVMAILTRLEIKDMVRPIPGGFYLRNV
jgi:DNA processing protein